MSIMQEIMRLDLLADNYKSLLLYKLIVVVIISGLSTERKGNTKCELLIPIMGDWV